MIGSAGRLAIVTVAAALLFGACSGADGAGGVTAETAAAATGTSSTATQPTNASEGTADGGTADDGTDQTTDATDTGGTVENSGTVTKTPTCAAPPESTTEIEFLPDWSTIGGRRLQVEIGKSRVGSGLSSTPITMDVTPHDDGGWEFDWQFEETNLDALGIDGAALTAEELADRFPSLALSYRIDELREWRGLTNVEQARGYLDSMFELIREIGDPDTADQVQTAFESLSDEDLAFAIAEDPLLYHTFEGLPFVVDEPVTGPDLLPNAFGGEPFPATTTIRVVELADPDGCTVMEMVVTPDPEELSRIIGESLRAAFDLPEEQIEAIQAGFEVENRIIARYDHGTGLLIDLEARQLVSDGSTEQVETRVITDLGPLG